MEVVGSDQAPKEAPIAQQLVHISLIATIAVVAVWAIANYVLDLLITML